MPSQKIQERADIEIAEDITRSGTLPATFYRDPQIFEQQKEKVFAKSWQYLTDLKSVGESAIQIPLTILPDSLSEPVILSREESGDLHLLSNVCTHRGSILLEEKKHSSRISCRYHGRCFSTCGKYVSAPGFEGAHDFPSEKDDLPTLALGRFDQFLFSGIYPELSFEDFIRPMLARTGFLPLADAELDRDNSREYLVNANWALYVDNYLEGLHIPFVHPALASMLDTKDYQTELFAGGNVQIGIATDGDDAFEIPESHPDSGRKIAAYYYWLFPNTMFNFYPWGISVNVVEPLAVDRTRVRFLTYVYDRSRMGSYSPESINITELEDEAVVEAVQKGVRSRLYKRGRYAPQWERGVHQFHRMLTDRL
ncbi:MAG: SRPBCC family protein [Cyanobacteriota/Melainabacteria group bacterium]